MHASAAGSPRRIAELADHLGGLTDAFTQLRVLGPEAVEVALVDGAAVDLDALRSLFPEVELRFTKARYSRADANALRERIVREWFAWPARGVTIHELHQDRTGRVVIGVADLGTARAVLEDAYGADRIVVELGEPAEALSRAYRLEP